MNHYMLKLGEIFFEKIMHRLRCLMSFPEGDCSIDPDLQIDIDASSELAGTEKIDASHFAAEERRA